MSNWRWTVCVAGLCLASAGCEPTPEQVERTDPQPAVAEIEPAPRIPEPDLHEPDHPGSATFSTWPGYEEHRTFEVMWLGGDGDVELYDEAGGDGDPLETASWLDGTKMEWLDSMVHVDEPRPLEVTRTVEIVATPYDVETKRLAADDNYYELSAGDRLFLYHYGGEQSCYYGVDDSIVLSDCLSDPVNIDDETGLDVEAPWTPLSKQWWLLVESPQGTRGWMLVDEAPVEIHERQLEGFDGVDGPDGPGEHFVD